MRKIFSDKLTFLVKKKYSSNWAEFSRVTKISGTTLQRMKNGAGTTVDTLLQISAATNVSIEWLLTGSGAMFRDSPSGDDSFHNDNDNYIRIPRLDIEASAGSGVFNPDTTEVIDYIPFTREFLQDKLHRAALSYPDYLKIIKVIGDSMAPTVADGDLVMLDLSCKHIQVDGIYAFVQDGTAKVKRLRFLKDGVEVSSDNKIYSAEVFTASDMSSYNFEILGPIRWIGRILLH